MAFQAAQGTRLDPAFLDLRIMDNSTTFVVGELVESLSTGYAKHATAASPALGVIIGFVDAVAAPIQPDTVTRSTTAYPGAITSVATAADNTTVAMKQAIVSCDPGVLWSAAVNGTIGTTAASNLPSCGINVDSANSNWGRVLESTATRTAATVTNFMTEGIDPNDSTRLLVRLSNSELFSSKRA